MKCSNLPLLKNKIILTLFLLPGLFSLSVYRLSAQDKDDPEMPPLIFLFYNHQEHVITGTEMDGNEIHYKYSDGDSAYSPFNGFITKINNSVRFTMTEGNYLYGRYTKPLSERNYYRHNDYIKKDQYKKIADADLERTIDINHFMIDSIDLGSVYDFYKNTRFRFVINFSRYLSDDLKSMVISIQGKTRLYEVRKELSNENIRTYKAGFIYDNGEIFSVNQDEIINENKRIPDGAYVVSLKIYTESLSYNFTISEMQFPYNTEDGNYLIKQYNDITDDKSALQYYAANMKDVDRVRDIAVRTADVFSGKTKADLNEYVYDEVEIITHRQIFNENENPVRTLKIRKQDFTNLLSKWFDHSGLSPHVRPLHEIKKEYADFDDIWWGSGLDNSIWLDRINFKEVNGRIYIDSIILTEDIV